jgi:hypothetical protein
VRQVPSFAFYHPIYPILKIGVEGNKTGMYMCKHKRSSSMDSGYIIQ